MVGIRNKNICALSKEMHLPGEKDNNVASPKKPDNRSQLDMI
jgi:hypothetical protein